MDASIDDGASLWASKAEIGLCCIGFVYRWEEVSWYG